MDRIANAIPWNRGNDSAHVLAWKILEDERPHRWACCLAVTQLEQETEEQERWVLASLAGDRAGKEWRVKEVWPHSSRDLTAPPIILYARKYRERPTNADIHRLIDEFGWKLGAEKDQKLIDGGVCKAWEKVIGEKPTLSFRR